MKKSSARERKPLDPDPELWAALGEGDLLNVVLRSFYDDVFEDDVIGSFFEGIDKEFIAQKQYSFLRDILTGDDSYFGAKPRNAHHWMVIDDAMFEHREEAMERHLRAHGVAEEYIARLRAIDEVYRKQIVKDEPRPMKISGVEIPFDGHELMTAECPLLCDGCSAEIETGESIVIWIRSGELLCAGCGAERVPSLGEPRASGEGS